MYYPKAFHAHPGYISYKIITQEKLYTVVYKNIQNNNKTFIVNKNVNDSACPHVLYITMGLSVVAPTKNLWVCLLNYRTS